MGHLRTHRPAFATPLQRVSAGGGTAETAMHPLLRLQQSAGNQAVQRLVAELTVQRDDTAAAVVAAAGATLGAKVKGKRPKPTNNRMDVGSCQEAADHLGSGAHVGQASPVYHPTVGKVTTKKQKDGTFKTSVKISWTLDKSSTMELIDFVWPGMTKAEKAAVKRFKALLKAHEVGHFNVQDAVVKSIGPTKVWAFGATPQEAIDNLQTEATTRNDAVGTEQATRDTDYDTTTDHGRKQSAVGGTDVVLECP
jgi:hypothetical protein